MTRDELTLKKFDQALGDNPIKDEALTVLRQVLAATKAAPAGGQGATAQLILEWLAANPEGGSARQIAEAVGCSVGRVYEVAKADGSAIVVTKGEGRQASRLVIPGAEKPAKASRTRKARQAVTA